MRRIRLAALADSPWAFAETYDTALAMDDERWAQFANRHSQGSLQAIFVADSKKGWRGVAGGYRSSAADSTVNLVGMWVAPQVRGNGVGRRLVDAIVDWSRDVGADRVELWVTIGNDPARRLYESYGFREVGDYQPLPSDPCKNETRMRLEVSRGPATF